MVCDFPFCIDMNYSRYFFIGCSLQWFLKQRRHKITFWMENFREKKMFFLQFFFCYFQHISHLRIGDNIVVWHANDRYSLFTREKFPTNSCNLSTSNHRNVIVEMIPISWSYFYLIYFLSSPHRSRNSDKEPRTWRRKRCFDRRKLKSIETK